MGLGDGSVNGCPSVHLARHPVVRVVLEREQGGQLVKLLLGLGEVTCLASELAPEVAGDGTGGHGQDPEGE